MNKGIEAQEILQIRQDFPLFRNDPVIYLDNSATTQKPDAVLNAVSEFYGHDNANPFRGIYDLSERATERYEAARETVSKFIHAESPSEIVFTRNASESLNLAANCLAELLLQPGDEVIVTIVEHHSNFLPWLQAAKRHGAALKFLECDAKGEIPLEALEEAITDKTRLVTMTQMSNVFGREYDVKAAAALCHSKGDIVVIADGSQSVPHIKVDVQDLGVDFLAFSGHKMLAPMGIGVLWGQKKWLDAMPPFLFGGEMIQSVSREGAVYAEVPHKFEAGTVNAGGAVGLEAAIHYIEQIGFDRIRQREEYLSTLMLEGIKKIPHVHLLGADTPEQHHGIFSFTVDDVHPHDVSAILADAGIAVRAGHHCAQPLLQHLGVNATTRASLAFYNTEAEVEAFLKTLREVRSQMGYAE